MSYINIDKINYDSIKYFINVANHGSISRSAYSLGISQSALSQSMKNLEESLGITLFNRNTRGIILTTEGRLFYEEAKIGKEHFESAIIKVIRNNKFESLKTFKISVSGTLFTILIAPIMKEVVKKYPRINFEIISLATEKDVVEKLQNEEIDLGIVKTYGKFIVKEVSFIKLQDIDYAFAYDPRFYNFNDSVALEELKDVLVINKRRTGRNDSSWITTSFNRLLNCESDRNVIELIKRGVGIGLVPEKYIESEGLKILKVKDIPPTSRTLEAAFLSSNTVAANIAQMIKEQAE